VIGVALWLAYTPWRWGKVKDEVRARFPTVKFIKSVDLQEWMATRTIVPPVLLDVRTAAEFEFSHLPGARRVASGGSLTENQLAGLESAKVVVYDSVGFDAAAFASGLLTRNFIDVQVLEGGIFLWANEGRVLSGPGGRPTKVLTGASEHAALLERSRRAP
jgi:rhodanese-related sulfurtransferase